MPPKLPEYSWDIVALFLTDDWRGNSWARSRLVTSNAVRLYLVIEIGCTGEPHGGQCAPGTDLGTGRSPGRSTATVSNLTGSVSDTVSKL
jgi:hypothetical protein